MIFDGISYNVTDLVKWVGLIGNEFEERKHENY